jgi:hypothetical protein
MTAVAKLELRRTEQVAGFFGDEEASHVQDFGFGFLGHQLGQTLGFGFVFWGQNEAAHGVSMLKRRVGFSMSSSNGLQSMKNPPTLQLPTPGGVLEGKRLQPFLRVGKLNS